MNTANIILIVKYIVATMLLMAVIFAPAYLARQNKKDGINMVIVRLSGWLLWWTGVGWLFALFWGCKK